jgi:hypothetical protein
LKKFDRFVKIMKPKRGQHRHAWVFLRAVQSPISMDRLAASIAKSL